MQITDYAPPANSQAFIKYPELELGSRSSQRLSYLSCAPGSDGILGTFPHSVLVICKGPMLQGHDIVSPALAKLVVKWLLLQTEGSKRAEGMQAALAGSRGDDQVTPRSPAHWHIDQLNHPWISPASRVTFFLHLVIHSLIYIYYGPLA